MVEKVGFQTLSTNDVPKAARLSRWNEFISDTFAIMRVHPENASDFNATLSRVRIGALGLSWYSTTASSGLVDVGRAGAWSAPVGDAFLLAVQETGMTTGHYLGREIFSQPGDLVLLDAGRPWRIDSREPMSAVAIKIPAERMLKVISEPEAACGIHIGTETPGVALASALLLQIKASVEENPTADWDAYESILIDIIAVAVNSLAEAGGPHSNRGGNQRREACAFIERNLDNPDLGVGIIAEAIGTSTRRVQRIFGEMGLTPRGYILERRIDVAAELLKRADHRDLSITDIAYAAGFSDLSHFIRCFRKKWGVAPRDYRAAHN